MISIKSAREERVRAARRPSPRAIDLFSGAGGLSLGLEDAGFTTVLAVEIARDACETYSALLPKANLEHTSIERIDFHRYRGRVELLAGGPPCQPFSTGGKKEGSADDRDFIPEFVRVVREVHPDAFLLENVPGLVQGATGPYFTRLIKRLTGLGYSVTWRVLNAADYGVPQKRRRLFVIGLRRGHFSFPAPTHGPAASSPHVPAATLLSVEQMIGEENPSKVFYAKNPDLRPSPYDGHLFNGGGRPIDLSQPCTTILASAGGNKTHFVDTRGLVPPYHQHLVSGGGAKEGTLPGGRRLTVQESALIQTFPRRAKFYGARSSQYTQVGNAVPPKLASVLGAALAGALTN